MKVGVMTGIGMDAKYARLESICRQYLSARSGVNGIGKVTFKKVALAIPRNAYLALVALNVFGIASKLNDAIAKNSPGVQKVWGKLGGDFSKLKNTVADGARKKPPLNIKGIGDPITLASIGTFLATAAPVAAAVGSVVKQVVGDSTDVVNTLNTAAKAAGGVSDIITNITTPPVAEPDPNAPLSFTNPGPDGVTWAWTSPEYKQVKIKPSGKVVTIPDSIKKSGYDPNKPVSVTNRPGVAPDSGPISQWLIDNGYVPNNVTLFSPDGSQIIVTDAEPGSASDAGSTSQSSALPWIAGGILALKAFSII